MVTVTTSGDPEDQDCRIDYPDGSWSDGKTSNCKEKDDDDDSANINNLDNLEVR